MMKKIMITYLSAAVAFGVLLTGCMQSGADSNQKEPTNISNDDSTPQVSVSPEHEQLIKEALELAKQGKAVTNQERYKDITEDEMNTILGDPYNTESADHLVGEYYLAGKYLMVVNYSCDSCMDDGKPLKITSIGVLKKTS
jgi:hypothetical protein